MKRYLLSRLAEDDLMDIWSYIAVDNEQAADRVLEALRSAMRTLADQPGMGHHREDVSDSVVRFWRVYSYLIAYRPTQDGIEVARVIHGMRDIPNLL